MKLTGSRATGTHDEFSDWDYMIEDGADLPVVEVAVAASLCWSHVRKGSVHVVTVIDADLGVRDFTATAVAATSAPGSASADDLFWERLRARPGHRRLADYWILAFKHLKALHRRYDPLLLDVGLDLSVAILRDLYVEKHFGPGPYQSPFDYRRIPPGHDFSALSAVTGLPTVTLPERVVKLRAMNRLVAALHPEPSRPLLEGFELKLSRITVAS